MDIVERLRAEHETTQWSRGGTLETYMAKPPLIHLEAAAAIDMLRVVVHILMRRGTPAANELRQIEAVLGPEIATERLLQI